MINVSLIIQHISGDDRGVDKKGQWMMMMMMMMMMRTRNG